MTYLRNLLAYAVLCFGVLCLFAGGGSPLYAQEAVPTSEHLCAVGVLLEPSGCAVTLAPGQSTSLSLAVAEGKVRMLTAEQVQGVVELRLSDAATASASSHTPQPFANQAGLHSHIHILVGTGEQVAISNPSKDGVAMIVLTVGAAQPADANSELERAAERAFAHAELLRIQDTQDHATAIKAYDEAIANWQSAGNRSELARALIWKADYIVNNEGKAPLALPVIERATPMLSDLNPIEAAHYWLVIAFIHVVHGDYDVVQDAYRRSLALYETAGDTGHQAKILDNSARVELMQGHSDVALSDERRAAELAAAAGDSRRQAFVQEELGAIYSTVGDSESAYRAYGEALQALKRLPPEPRMEAAIWVDLSDLYMTLGDFARVQDSLDQATAIWKTTDYPVGMTDTLNNYGDLYLVKGSPLESRKYFERGLELAKRIDYERGSIALMSGLGDSYLYVHDAVHAEQVLNSALARAKKAQQADSEMQVHCQLGDLALLKHDVKEAAEQYATCSKEAVAANDVYTRIRAEGGLARTALESGALDDGQTHCEQALGMIEATRGQLRNQDLKTSFFASQNAYYDLDIQILERLDQAHPNEGYQWQAFLITERARARTLLDQVAATNGELRSAAAQPLLAQYEDVERRLRRFEASAAPLRGPQKHQASNTVRAAIARLTVSEHQLHQEILAAGEADTSSAPSHSLTLEALEDALPDRHAALVEYWSGEKASYAWSITPMGIRSFRLPPADELNRQCMGFRKALLAAVSPNPRLTAEQRAAMRLAQEEQLRKLGIQLSRNLLPRGMLASGTATVFIVADGPIESIPFAALPDGLKAPLRDTVFLNEPSATIFSILESNSITSHPMRLAVFALGATSTSTQDGKTHSARQSNGRNHPQEFSSLPFAGDEAMMIRATMGTEATQLFSGARIDQATLQNLNWNEFSIGHFAMHAILNQQYAELSGLTLGRERVSGAGSGNFLWYGDVRHLHAKLDLVVLSACNTALGERVPGEGLRGLTQAFFAAGSQRVLGTLWEVDDQATSEWMRHFYQSLKKTRSPATALHDAQKAMAADPQWSAPYYWAGFVLAGDWRPLP
jgi:CHAT domain-containing protein